MVARFILALLVLAAPVLAEPQAPAVLDTFPFEEYENNEAFLTAAREAFPVGSSFTEVKKTLLKSGASPIANPATPNQVFAYRKNVGKLYDSAAMQWTVTVAERDDKVRSISTDYGLISLQPNKAR